MGMRMRKRECVVLESEQYCNIVRICKNHKTGQKFLLWECWKCSEFPSFWMGNCTGTHTKVKPTQHTTLIMSKWNCLKKMTTLWHWFLRTVEDELNDKQEWIRNHWEKDGASDILKLNLKACNISSVIPNKTKPTYTSNARYYVSLAQT